MVAALTKAVLHRSSHHASLSMTRLMLMTALNADSIVSTCCAQGGAMVEWLGQVPANQGVLGTTLRGYGGFSDVSADLQA